MFNYTCLEVGRGKDFIENVSGLDHIFWGERPVLSHLLLYSLEHSRRFSYQRRLRYVCRTSRQSYKEREREIYKNTWGLGLFSQGESGQSSAVRIQLGQPWCSHWHWSASPPSPPCPLAEKERHLQRKRVVFGELGFKGKEILWSEGYFPQATTESSAMVVICHSTESQVFPGRQPPPHVSFVPSQTKCEVGLTAFSIPQKKQNLLASQTLMSNRTEGRFRKRGEDCLTLAPS